MALAAGLAGLGLGPGDHLAIIGRNRPALYWAMVAAQVCGAVPVPLYQDAVAEEMAFVLEHCGARFVVAGDQEQVDKVLEVSGPAAAARADRLSRPARPPELRPRPAARLRRGAGAGTRRRRRGARGARGAHRRAGRGRHLRDALHLRHHRAAEGGRALEPQHHRDRAGERRLRPAERRRTACSPTCRWPGSATSSSRWARRTGPASASPARRAPATMQHDLREIGPTYFFAPPRFYEGAAHQRDDPDGGRRPRQAGAVPPLHGARPPGRPGDPRRAPGRRRRPRRATRSGELLVYGPLRNVLGLSRIRVGYTAGEAIGPEIFAFYRALGINLKQLYGQTEASVFITQQPDGEVRADTVGVASPGGRAPDRRERRGLLPLARRLRRVLQEPGEHRRDQGRRGLGRDRRRRLHRARDRAPPDHRPGQGRGPDGRRAACSRRSTSRTS